MLGSRFQQPAIHMQLDYYQLETSTISMIRLFDYKWVSQL